MNKKNELFDENEAQHSGPTKVYLMFCQIQHHKFRSKYPKCTPSQIEELMSQKWNKMSQKKKQFYADSALHMIEHESNKINKNRQKNFLRARGKAKGRGGHTKETDEFVPQSNSRNDRYSRQYPAPILDDGEQFDQFQDEEECKNLFNSINFCNSLTCKTSSFDVNWYDDLTFIPSIDSNKISKK
ncbi:hypothetical protein TRFO_10461 [Tritrichomonas foetus]|uniref:HMG box domain-containing protein n=1 Tax=Tritrichomonas foetus TaxID=1144522 RepID=A0A1J4J8Q0_9EUKA|nr:hypothetical protein TRFO_10461 [Tritrichomonas foetus]|eukprot:OHS95562.1 hypothetical protein TRFO_10461 [Tritrichomonas foetus]